MNRFNAVNAALAPGLSSRRAFCGGSLGLVLAPAWGLTPAPYPELWASGSHDGALEASLKQTVGTLDLMQRVERGTLSIAVADITDLQQPRYADLNGEQMYYAASLPKIAILLGAFYKSHASGEPMPGTVMEDALLMIRYSNNQAATRVFNWVGFDFLRTILESEQFKLYDRERNGGLWVGRAYASESEYMRDPLHQTSHGANALQIARYWYFLATGRFVNPQISETMKTMMGNPVFNNKFVLGLKSRPGLRIFRKTGTFRASHADGALIEVGDGPQQRRYIMTGLVNEGGGGAMLTQLAAPLYDLLEDEHKRR